MLDFRVPCSLNIVTSFWRSSATGYLGHTVNSAFAPRIDKCTGAYCVR